MSCLKSDKVAVVVVSILLEGTYACSIFVSNTKDNYQTSQSMLYYNKTMICVHKIVLISFLVMNLTRVRKIEIVDIILSLSSVYYCRVHTFCIAFKYVFIPNSQP
jgi:hypothetical protein